jgi:hypothetical protein
LLAGAKKILFRYLVESDIFYPQEEMAKAVGKR